jgi:L-fuconolactonase
LIPVLIDAHQHYWQLGKNGHEWPTVAEAPIFRDFGPDDWSRAATPRGISGSVLVQAQPNSEETEWLIALGKRHSSIKAIVGWADLKSPTVPQRIAALAGRPKVKGLRPMLQNLPEDAWIADAALEPAVAAMVKRGLRFDALVFTRHLPHLAIFAERFPELPIVIDHGAKPAVALGNLDPWRDEIRKLSSLPNVHCKLSGLLTEMSIGQQWEALIPYVEHLCTCFGTDRLMWGSDWPVVLLADGYTEWFDLAVRLTGFDAEGRAKLFGGNAAAFYGLEDD